MQQQMDPNDAAAAAAAMGAALVCYLVFAIIIYVFIGICLMKIFTKANKPGWAGFVPIYNAIVLLEIIGKPLWWIVLLIIPCVQIVPHILISLDLAKSFGKSGAFGIGIAFLWFVFLPILAFGDAKYQGPQSV